MLGDEIAVGDELIDQKDDDDDREQTETDVRVQSRAKRSPCPHEIQSAAGPESAQEKQNREQRKERNEDRAPSQATEMDVPARRCQQKRARQRDPTIHVIVAEPVERNDAGKPGKQGPDFDDERASAKKTKRASQQVHIEIGVVQSRNKDGAVIGLLQHAERFQRGARFVRRKTSREHADGIDAEEQRQADDRAEEQEFRPRQPERFGLRQLRGNPTDAPPLPLQTQAA